MSGGRHADNADILRRRLSINVGRQSSVSGRVATTRDREPFMKHVYYCIKYLGIRRVKTIFLWFFDLKNFTLD